jgi:hypothetical protein
MRYPPPAPKKSSSKSAITHQQNQHHWNRQAIMNLIQYKEYQKDFKDTSIKNAKVWSMIKDTFSENSLICPKYKTSSNI